MKISSVEEMRDLNRTAGEAVYFVNLAVGLAIGVGLMMLGM